MLQASESPLYRQIADELRRQISAGELRPGEPLPSEHDLMRRFGVSRGTVRQARESLRSDGTIAGTRGRRFDIKLDHLTQPLHELIGFSAWAESLGRHPSAQVIDFGSRTADAEIAAGLRVAEGSQIQFLVRLRLADGEPLMIERTAFPPEIGRRIAALDLETRSIYAELAAQGVVFASATHHISAVIANRDEGRTLRISPGSALLRLRRIAFSPDGAPLEYAEDRYRADRVDLAIENSMMVSRVMRGSDERDNEGGT